jgi:hypothetical protein
MKEKICRYCQHAPRWGRIENIGGEDYAGGPCRLRGAIVRPGGCCHMFSHPQASKGAWRSGWRPELEQRGPVTGGLFAQGGNNEHDA